MNTVRFRGLIIVSFISHPPRKRDRHLTEDPKLTQIPKGQLQRRICVQKKSDSQKFDFGLDLSTDLCRCEKEVTLPH